jgi:hypothetical protein
MSASGSTIADPVARDAAAAAPRSSIVKSVAACCGPIRSAARQCHGYRQPRDLAQRRAGADPRPWQSLPGCDRRDPDRRGGAAQLKESSLPSPSWRPWWMIPEEGGCGGAGDLENFGLQSKLAPSTIGQRSRALLGRHLRRGAGRGKRDPHRQCGNCQDSETSFIVVAVVAFILLVVTAVSSAGRSSNPWARSPPSWRGSPAAIRMRIPALDRGDEIGDMAPSAPSAKPACAPHGCRPRWTTPPA